VTLCDKLCVIELGKAGRWEASCDGKGAAEHESSLGFNSEELGVVVVVVGGGDIAGDFRVCLGWLLSACFIWRLAWFWLGVVIEWWRMRKVLVMSWRL